MAAVADEESSFAFVALMTSWRALEDQFVEFLRKRVETPVPGAADYFEHEVTTNKEYYRQ